MYKIIKDKKLYFLKNETIHNMYCTVSYNTCKCCETIPNKEIVLEKLEVKEIPILDNTTNKVSIKYFNGITNIVEEKEIPIYSFLQEELLKDIRVLLCGDECCKECMNDEQSTIFKESQNIFNKLLIYDSFINKTQLTNETCVFNNYLKEALKIYDCDILNTVIKDIDRTRYLYDFKTDLSLLKKFLAIYYIGFYLRELINSTPEQKIYINALYSSQIFLNCIKNLGICTEKLFDIFEKAKITCTISPTNKDKTISIYTLPNTYIFTKEDFISDENTNNIIIKNIPANGILEFDDKIIDKIPFKFDVKDVTKLKYITTELGNLKDPFDIITFQSCKDIFCSNINSICINTDKIPRVESLLYSLVSVETDVNGNIETIIKVNYTKGNGVSYPTGPELSSTGVEGLKLILQQGTLKDGEDGEIYFILKGNTQIPGLANFNVQFANIKLILDVNIINNYVNNPPIIGNTYLKLNNKQNHVFTLENFTTETVPPYTDQDNDSLTKIKINQVNLTPGATILYKNLPVKLGKEIPAIDIINGLLKYLSPNINDKVISEFVWSGNDGISPVFKNGKFIIKTSGVVNLPPQNVGDNSITIENQSTITLTEKMFTFDTIPRYYDPEGDAPFELRIDKLPTKGVLLFNNTIIPEGNIVSFSSIRNGLLTYVGPNTTTKEIDSFEFSISDEGSRIFKS